MFDDDTNDFDLTDPRNSWRLESILADIDRSIEMAEVRLRPTTQLIDSLPSILTDADSDRILYHLEEVQLEPAEAESLVKQVEILAGAWEKLPSREKARADGVLWRLVKAIPEPHLSKIAISFLVHPRKRRREMAYKVLRRTDIPVTLLDDLITLYETTGDEQLLHLIARNPALVVAADERYLLGEIATSYWQMRVVEVLLLEQPERALALAFEYPSRFVHAVGRREADEYLPLLRRLFAPNRNDPRFLGIYAWALGRVGDTAALEELRGAIVELRERLETTGA
ncbi:MAG TPA: hypothetical protein VEK57_23895 [Thermoanaerobaculia bacterium]|nr:hypothetical protein [Thermoanaerobaculia bacterium]